MIHVLIECSHMLPSNTLMYLAKPGEINKGQPNIRNRGERAINLNAFYCKIGSPGSRHFLLGISNVLF